jgi:hypothetical protein
MPFQYRLIGMEAATPGGTTRAEDPGLSNAREAAKAMSPERVRRNGNQPLLFREKNGPSHIVIFLDHLGQPDFFFVDMLQLLYL